MLRSVAKNIYKQFIQKGNLKKEKKCCHTRAAKCSLSEHHPVCSRSASHAASQPIRGSSSSSSLSPPPTSPLQTTGTRGDCRWWEKVQQLQEVCDVSPRWDTSCWLSVAIPLKLQLDMGCQFFSIRINAKTNGRCFENQPAAHWATLQWDVNLSFQDMKY